MPEQDATGRARPTSTRSTSGSPSSSRCSRPSAASSARSPNCIDGCPVARQHPALHRAPARRRPARRRRLAPRRQRPALRHRPRLPAGDPVRGRLPPRQEGHAGRDRLPRALRRRLGARPTATSSRRTPPAPTGKTVAVVGSGPGRPDRRRRARQARPRRHDLRGLPRARRRARSTASPSSACPRTSSRRRSTGSREPGVKIELQRDHRQDLHPAPSCASSSTPSSSPTAPACRSS